MSFYYEYKSCCGKKDRVADVDHEQDCFCGKGIEQFIGRNVTIRAGETTETGVLSFNKKTGLVTLISGTTVRTYCCNNIDFIQTTAV